uniref:Uncharacterized protein n=1 Tax=Arundo donax TaxID=35708 RepID=A0A0A9FGN2_ARUDO
MLSRRKGHFIMLYKVDYCFP